MRGKVRLLYHRGEFFRITPAYAGKSEERNQKNSRAKDHPRLCGEKKKCSVEITRLKGSPPPMRGKDAPRIDSDAV